MCQLANFERLTKTERQAIAKIATGRYGREILDEALKQSLHDFVWVNETPVCKGCERRPDNYLGLVVWLQRYPGCPPWNAEPVGQPAPLHTFSVGRRADASHRLHWLLGFKGNCTSNDVLELWIVYHSTDVHDNGELMESVQGESGTASDEHA